MKHATTKTQLRVVLSPREQEILTLIADEYTTSEIASELYLSSHTVITHRKNLLTKMAAKNSAGLVRRAIEVGVLKIQLANENSLYVQSQY